MIEEHSILSVALDESAQPIPPAPDAIRELPLLPLRTTVLFPRAATTVLVTSPQAQAALEAALQYGTSIVTVDEVALEPVTRNASQDPIGVEAQVTRVVRLPDGTANILLVGLWRVEVRQVQIHAELVVGHVVWAEANADELCGAEQAAVVKLLSDVTRLSRTLPPRVYELAKAAPDGGALADLIASELPLSVARRREVLVTVPVRQRLHVVEALLREELTVLQREQQLRQVGETTQRPQRPVDASSTSLGEESRLEAPDITPLRDLLAAAGLPAAVRSRADEELARIELLPPGTPDYSVVRAYLQWLASLPWQQDEETGPTDLRRAAVVLDEHHYGLRKVKDRILEHLAVRNLVGTSQHGAILCFVGPPGVGKTSLGRAMATALQRPFVRVALGGIHDEAEIRGHRRTYVNALPGRIVKAMREAGTLNPVFMLDEIDKLRFDQRGDPQAALLEVLDPEQNHAWSDHYLDVPYDLSRVLFVCTANTLDDLEDALVDRLEVIDLGGYAEDEKLEIARRFLLPRQIAANGLTSTPIKVPEATLRQLTRTYTFEAGVRGLERELGTLCRKVARRIAEGRPYPRRIDPSLLPTMLGPERYEYGRQQAHDEVGLATGMVWTEHGGDILGVEIAVVDGKGDLKLTGQLGEIMQESAQAALMYTRVNAKRLGIDPRRFEKIDIHVHLPEGGVPKDGPSAGITVVSALVSALTGRALKRTVAMTGEVTLRGRVLQVGGIREKVLGAYRAGIEQIIVPARNERELVDELPPTVRNKLTITYVTTMDEVFPLAFAENPLDHPWQPRKRKPRASGQ